MAFWHSLDRRIREPEVMDQPNLDRNRHHVALDGLARINWLSRSAAILWPPLAELGNGRPIRVLDLASGGGDVPLALWRKARKANVSFQIDGCDQNPTAIDIANRRCRDAGADVRFFQLDLLNDQWPVGYDAAICSLFLHHLSDEKAIELLRRASQVAERLILINDLIRCRSGLLLAHFAGRVLTRSDVVRVDGPRSVRAAFTRAEAEELACRAGLAGATITARWPCRYLLQWKRPAVAEMGATP